MYTKFSFSVAHLAHGELITLRNLGQKDLPTNDANGFITDSIPLHIQHTGVDVNRAEAGQTVKEKVHDSSTVIFWFAKRKVRHLY